MKKFVRRDILFILIVLSIGLFLRVYRLDELLGFYYDQGRDALVIRDLIVRHKLFLIGPTTGIEGIFLGPLYYLTLLPWYFLGHGNPVLPAIYQSVTTILAIAVLGKFAAEVYDKRTALVFIVLGSFSYWLIIASRWLANPTQLMLASSLALFGLGRVAQGRKNYWLLVVAATAAGLQFEAAGATFFLPALIVFILLNRETLPNLKVGLLASSIFILSLMPQVLFDFRHDHILLKSFSRFLISERSFGFAGLFTQFQSRFEFLLGALTNKLFPNPTVYTSITMIFLTISAIRFRKLFSLKGTTILIVWLLAPVIGLTLYQGNHGYVWDYYLTGVYLVFLLLVAAFICRWWAGLIGKLVLAVFLLLFFWANLPVTRNYLIAGTDGPTNVVLGNETQAVKWILADGLDQNGQYNIDEYVPPVIPYSYEYLIWWLTSENHVSLTPNQVPTLYTLYEVDPPHPERLTAWLSRQDGIGTVVKTATFGGVIVQRRVRIPEADLKKINNR